MSAGVPQPDGAGCPQEQEPDGGGIARLLADRRPRPSPQFRGDLRRRLEAGAGHARPSPRRLWVLVTAFTVGGSLLLAIAGIGLAGSGPLG